MEIKNEINIKNLFEKNKELLINKVILDIGSNVGDFSKKIIENIPYKHIHLFEPVKKYYLQGKESLQTHNNLSFHNIALGSSNERKKIYICNTGNNGWNTLLIKDPYQYDDFYNYMDNEDVEVKRLDDYLNNIEQLDFIKIDVEGFECEVLEGAFDLIRKFKPYILIEVGWGNKHPNWLKNLRTYQKLFDIGYEEQDLNFSETRDVLFTPSLTKLPISIGILSWNSRSTLENTLNSYKNNGLFEISNDIQIIFQETDNKDIEIANKFNLPYIKLDTNIGIGKAFQTLANNAKYSNILLLEHDWELIENKETTHKRLSESLFLINNGVSCIRLRHRKDYGFPLYTRGVYEGNELNYLDKNTNLNSPHMFDCVYWKENPELDFPEYITKKNNYFYTNSRWSGWTNNPCLYKKDFYLYCIKNFVGEKIELEEKISKWWAEQKFIVAQGEGLFRHNDMDKNKRYNLVDVFPYFNEDELLELRIRMLDKYVDKFIICEANRTHSGHPKEYTCKRKLEGLGLLSSKIRVVEVDLSEYSKNDNWGRERNQRNAAANFIDHDDVCFVSDLDEIINPESIRYYSHMAISNSHNIIRVPMIVLCSRADLAECREDGNLEKTSCAFFCLKNHIEECSLSELRESDAFRVSSKFTNGFLLDDGIIKDAGWHFTWMGDANRRLIKYKSFAHYYNKENPEQVLPPNILDDFSSKDPNFKKDLLNDWLSRMLPFGEKTEEYILSYTPSEGEVDTLGRKKILKKYPLELLPQEIFENEKIKNFLLPD